jgi:hypothetical protein
MVKVLRTTLLVTGMFVAVLVLGSAAHADAAPTRADANWQSPFIAIVWPQNGGGVFTPVGSSKAVNISVWPTNSVSCTTPPTQAITLWQAKNNEPAVPVNITPQFFGRTQNNVKFSSLEFNTVPADMAADPMNRYYFMLGGFQGNVWVDATDARTYLPYPVQPSGFTETAALTQVDTRIQIVYPHDRDGKFASLDKATLVNVAVDIFEHGTLKSVPADYKGGPIVLYIAEANFAMGLAQADAGASTVVATANYEPYKIGDVTYPRWVFNNVKVTPGKQYHYMVRVQSAETFPTIWTHSQDVRTYLPNPTVPPPCG